ncbi:ATP synthase F0 subunit A [Streptococcus pneumoniae]|nr:ATP synthase F0 subunit A [Streptococcus pneumoniae]
MEESINPIISIGPVIFNLTMLAMTLLLWELFLSLFIGQAAI